MCAVVCVSDDHFISLILTFVSALMAVCLLYGTVRVAVHCYNRMISLSLLRSALSGLMAKVELTQLISVYCHPLVSVLKAVGCQSHLRNDLNWVICYLFRMRCPVAVKLTCFQ